MVEELTSNNSKRGAQIAWQSCPSSSLLGEVLVPADKSISHRCVIMAGLSTGVSRISNLLESADVMATLSAMRAMGVRYRHLSTGEWEVEGVGVGGICTPNKPLDLQNSGTGARLLMGLIASHNLTVIITGDKSLSARPMNRVLKPLQQVGLEILSFADNNQEDEIYLPLTLKGAIRPCPGDFLLSVPSAQVKSAILLSALNCPGKMRVTDPYGTRDHTERLLQYCGVGVEIDALPQGNSITISGYPVLHNLELTVARDISSAAFLIVAALLVPGSQISLPGILLNPSRNGILECLWEMGGDITISNERVVCGETVGDLVVKHSSLKAISVPKDRAPRMIDEYPIFCIAAAMAKGKTVMEGLKELTVKESNRLEVMYQALQQNGVHVEKIGVDGLVIEGQDCIIGGGFVKTSMDHRIAMSFLVAGLIAQQPIMIDSADYIGTSFPGFIDMFNGIGADIKRC